MLTPSRYSSCSWFGHVGGLAGARLRRAGLSPFWVGMRIMRAAYCAAYRRQVIAAHVARGIQFTPAQRAAQARCFNV